MILLGVTSLEASPEAKNDSDKFWRGPFRKFSRIALASIKFPRLLNEFEVKSISAPLLSLSAPCSYVLFR